MSASESAFSDAEESLTQFRKVTERKRQRSVGEMIRAVEKRKRVISPKQVTQDSGERGADLMEELKNVRKVIGGDIAELWEKIEKRFDTFESRLDKLEGAIFERDERIDGLERDLQACQKQIAGFEDQLEELERHSRSANLVLRSMEFGKRREGEDVRALAVQVLKENFPKLTISKGDFSAVHRLATENCVICAFKDRNLRNEIFEERVSLRNRQVEFRKRLYVNESLTKNKAQIFNRLLSLKRDQRIWTVYTRGGIPVARIQKESPPTRVYSLKQLELIERGLEVRPAPGPRAGSAGSRDAPLPPARRPRPGGAGGAATDRSAEDRTEPSPEVGDGRPTRQPSSDAGRGGATSALESDCGRESPVTSAGDPGRTGADGGAVADLSSEVHAADAVEGNDGSRTPSEGAPARTSSGTPMTSSSEAAGGCSRAREVGGRPG